MAGLNGEEDGVAGTANSLKQKILANEPNFVFAMRMSRTVNIDALAATCGYDGLYVDLQHSSIDLDMAAQIFQAGLLSDVTVFARVPSLEPGTIGRVMDAGAMGILAPDIRSGDDARLLVKAALIAPKGERSVGSGIPNPRFRDVPAAALADRINAATLLIAMIETPEGVVAAEEIAAVEGIDAVEIGSNDLTTAMGIPNQYDHERLREAYRHVIAACRKHGKPMIAGGIRGRKLLESYIAMGASRSYFVGTDTGFMLQGAQAVRADAQAADDAVAA